MLFWALDVNRGRSPIVRHIVCLKHIRVVCDMNYLVHKRHAFQNYSATLNSQIISFKLISHSNFESTERSLIWKLNTSDWIGSSMQVRASWVDKFPSGLISFSSIWHLVVTTEGLLLVRYSNLTCYKRIRVKALDHCISYGSWNRLPASCIRRFSQKWQRKFFISSLSCEKSVSLWSHTILSDSSLVLF